MTNQTIITDNQFRLIQLTKSRKKYSPEMTDDLCLVTVNDKSSWSDA